MGALLRCPISAIGLIASSSLGSWGSLHLLKSITSLSKRERALRLVSAGEPIEASLWMTGQINIMNQSGEADITIPISGPKGSGSPSSTQRCEQACGATQRLRLR